MGNKQSIDHFAKEHGVEDHFLPILYLIFDESLEGVIDGNGSDEDENEEQKRKNRLYRYRLTWDDHVTKCLHEGSFQSKYKMSHGAFEYLVNILRPRLQRNKFYARNGEYIIPELRVAISIRFLGGEPYTALNDIINVSTGAVYAIKDSFLDALLDCDELKIRFPDMDDAEGWERIRQGFENISTHQLFRHVVGTMDGFFAPTPRPSMKDSNGNPMAYMSGHYNQFGLNCQAVCDARERYLFFGVVAPGKTNDCLAFEYCTRLKEILAELPYGLFIVADAAYTPSEKILIPFTGPQKSDVDKDAFNYYLSQVRIRIEMAFGRMVNKWRILRAPLLGDLKTISKHLRAIAVLHNFVIDFDGHNEHLEFVQRNNDDNCQDMNFIIHNAPSGLSYLPTIPDQSAPEEMPNYRANSSTVQSSILRAIRENTIRRPRHNILRNGLGNTSNEPTIAAEYYAPG